MEDPKIIVYENKWERPSVKVEINVEKKHIKTDAEFGLDFYHALVKAWAKNKEVISSKFPLDDPSWVYEFTKGIPSGPIRP